MEELQAKLDAEKKAMEEALAAKEAELANAAGDDARTKELEAQVAAERAANEKMQQEKLKRLMDEGLRQK